MIGRILIDGDDRRIIDDGEYVILTGDTTDVEAPDPPAEFAYNPTTGALTWNEVLAASEYRITANEVDAGTNGPRTRVVATIAAPTLTTTDSVLDEDDARAYEIKSYDDYGETVGSPAVIFSSGENRKL